MNCWLRCVLLVVVTHISAMVETPIDILEGLPRVEPTKPSQELLAAQRLAEQERLLLQNERLRADHNHLRTIIQKQPITVIATPDSSPSVVLTNGEIQKPGLTAAEQRDAIARAGTHASFVSKVPAKTVPPTEMQKQIQRAEDVLVRIVDLTNKMHTDDSYEEVIPLEDKLAAIEEFEKKMNSINAQEVTDSGLPEKIDAVKEFLKDAIDRKNKQLAAQQEAEKQAQEDARQQGIKIATYLADPSIQEIMAKPFDSIPLSDLAGNLELLGLRNFILDEEIVRLPVGSVERAQLVEIQQFERLAFKKLEKEAPSFSKVKDTILDLIGSTGTRGVFRKQAEEKIAFLQDKEIMSRLDPVSKQYVEEAIAQFHESIQKVIEILTHPDESLVGSLEKALSQFESQAGSNGGYNQQNELYRYIHQVQDSAEVLRCMVSGVSVPSTFARDTYITQLRAFGDISGHTLLSKDRDPSDKDIALAIKRVLSPDVTVKFLDSKVELDRTLGKQVAGKVGKEVLDIPLGSLTNPHGYVLSEADGQQLKLVFETVVKELGVDPSTFSSVPKSWQCIPYDFLEKIGDVWLRNFDKNNANLSDVVRFKKEQVLCEAWQVAKLDDRATGRIDIFRQISTELLTSPLAKSLLKSLESKTLGVELFTPAQRINAERLLGYFPVVKGIPDGLNDKETRKFIEGSIDEAEFKKQEKEQTLKGESVEMYFPRMVKNLSTFLAAKQGPARAGVGFLENMQVALFDSKRVTQLVEQKQLPFVLKELTAFQQSVLQGKSVDDFSNEWWQVELYQRAEVFKNAVRTLDLAVSDDSSEEEQQAVQDFVSHIKVVLGDYKEQLIKQRWQQREKVVLDQSRTFPAQMKQWDTLNTTLKGQTVFGSDELLAMHDQQQSLEQFLQQAPVLLKQVADLIENDSKSPNLKQLTTYQKQLKTAQKKYDPYLIRWKALLESNPIVEVAEPSKLLVGYQKRAQALISKFASMNKAEDWQALDSEYTAALTKDLPTKEEAEERKVILQRLFTAKAQIETLRKEAPELLEQAKAYQGILGDKSDIAMQLKEACDQLDDAHQKTYDTYVKKWKVALKRFGPHI